MHYDSDLRFFRRLLEKMRIPCRVADSSNATTESFDFGLRKFLGREPEYSANILRAMELTRENEVYKITDTYHCTYLFLILPDTDNKAFLVVGPYIAFQMDNVRLLEETERLGLPASASRQLKSFYDNVPLLQDDSQLMLALDTLAEALWGSEQAYRITDLTHDHRLQILPPPATATPADTVMQMRLMEQRYAYENELMDKVSRGLLHRTEMMLQSATPARFEQRMTDLLRNQKNYCIICNTLLRKAAEKGGVHPFHLDRLSSQFAQKIELLTSVKAGNSLITEMAQAYCQLVRRHSMKGYSALVQTVITGIEADLSADLSLGKLAKQNSVSPEYLSTLFHRETGKTLTQFINEKRMELGAALLRGSPLQIQTIAEHCGFPDAGYFSKLFKKHYSLTPKEFRAQQPPPKK